LTATGNVGIGTAAPTERLQVSDGNVAITNTDGTARQLRLYEPSGAGTNFTAFQAQAQASDIIYTLPASLTPTSAVGAGILQTDASGNLSWLNPTALVTGSAWALTGNSGTNPAVNFLGTTDAQPLVIRTNNTERMRVTATGNVGIGTAAPALRLAIVDAGVGLDRPAANVLALYTNNTERVRITATGNVGIGTAAPTERLQVSDGNVAITNTDNTARQLRLYEPSGAGANFTAFQAQAQASDIIYTLPASLTPTSAVGAGILQTDASGNLSWLSPAALVTGSAWALTGNSITGTEFLGTTNAQPLVIRTNNTERMRVTATGNVGIGTASPTTALHVVAASNPLRLQGVQVSTQDTALVIDANGVITKRSLVDVVKANTWSLTGNSGTSHLNFLGTTDSARLEIRVRNVPAWRAEPVAVGATPNIIGGMGFVTGGAVGATIGGGGATSFYNEVSDNYGTVAGGYRNIVGNQNTNPADAAYAFIGGGAFNFARNAYAAVAGGAENAAWGQYSFIGGGYQNSTASGATGATVVGGYVNTANGAYAAIGGGVGNFAGAYSAIPGGYNLRIGNSSFGFSGQSSGLVTDLTTYSNIAVFVDVDLWLYSRDRTQASQLRFYEAQAHGSGANYVALRAPTSLSANTTYTLPADLTPTSTVGVGILQTNASGNLSWLNPTALVTGSAWALTGNSGTNPAVNFLGTTDAQPLVIRTNNTERMRVTATGNVGIGTATPTERLQVSDGNVAITNTDNTARQLRLYEPSGAGANFTAFRAQAQASDIIYTLPASLTPTSAVGAGILQTDASGNLSWLAPSALVSNYGWSLTGNSGTDPSVNFIGTTDNQPLVFRVNNVERMRITQTGAVRIGGIQYPRLLIETNSSSAGDAYLDLAGYRSTDATVGYIIARNKIIGDPLNDIVTRVDFLRDGNNDAGAIAFVTRPTGGSLTERMRLTSTGNVGIGTTTPIERLQVNNGNVAITNTDNTARQLRLV
jgi:hypothetical protein